MPSLCEIIGVGARGPLGLSALHVALCARAGKLEPRKTPWRDRRGAAIGAARARCLPDDLHGYARLIALGAPALREAAFGLEGPLSLLLALPEPGRPDDDERLGPAAIADLARASGVPLDLERSEVVRAGHAGGGLALELAVKRLRDASDPRRPQVVIVGGIDSYFHPEVLAWLDRARRLHSAEAVDGILPGEGAAFVALAVPGIDGGARRDRRLPRPLGAIAAVASGREETVLADEPNLAAAMTRAARAAATSAGGEPIRWVLSDINGERHRNTEWQRVLIRSNDFIPVDVRHDALPERLGDTGAASGPLLLAIACAWFRAGFAPAPRALVLLHAEGAERAALVLDAVSRPEPERPAGPAWSEAPALREAPVAQEALDRVVLSLRRLPPGIERAPLKAALDEALAALSRWSASPLHDPGHLEALDAAAALVVAARERLERAGEEGASRAKTLLAAERALRLGREATIDRIVADQRRLLQGEAPPVAPPEEPFLASVGEPALHATARRPLVPLVPLEPPGAEPPAAPPAAPDAERAHLEALARDCMEDLAILGTLRRPHADDAWTVAASFEQRLLDNIDALSSLNTVEPGASREVDVLPLLLSYAVEPAFVDPGRAFARALGLGCAGGEDCMRAVVTGLRCSDPATLAAQTDALCLAPSPLIRGAMERLVWDEDPALSRLALEVLRFRRGAGAAVLLPLLSHPDLGVIEAALRALAAAEPREAAAQALAEAARDSLEERARLAAAEGLLRLGALEGTALLARALSERQGPHGDLSVGARCEHVRLLALSGGPEHADLLSEAALGLPEGAAAIGWFGHTGLVDPLLDQLTAANALRRTLGPFPTPFELAAARALVRILGVYLEDPEDELGVGIALDAEPWRACWEERRAAFDPGKRYRFGRPYHPLATLEELASDDTPSRLRIDAALELGALFPGGWALEPGDWVARQRAQLAAARLQVEALAPAYVAGEWPATYLGRRRVELGGRIS